MKSFYLFIATLLVTMPMQLWAQTEHPALGTKVSSADGKFTITLLSRKQNYSYTETATLDKDIRSPKSVNIHPNGEKFYVNSLEGGKTVVYATGSNEKLKVIEHAFTEADSLLWATPSGLYPFTHYKKNLNTFRGKPVESAFSHNGRYLWVPYYRRSYDINAQDPSAVAVIDTQTDSIIKLMETGPLPKMVAVSGDNRYVAITHWGNNTVGIINIDSNSPDMWYYEDCVTIQHKLALNFSLTTPVNRDVNSGLCLRGTVFTPDGRYLLVGCMGGNGGIGVIDLKDFSYLGHVYGMKTNLRHIVIRNDYLYLSINKEGYIQRIPLETFYEAIDRMENGKVTLSEWENCKVAAGARTIDITPDGRYVVAACNFSSRLVVVDTETFKEIARIKADSYPVGLDISKDGKFVYTTSQGREGGGGNCVDIYQMEY
ncbi:MAG: beta-propeller fold lactonase family protein [Bacteroidales bacterium]|nr:beta-propeller fold lactonase family protein [Bacteroidales bacterium]